ncbi:MAG: DUF4386 domain-containing protein [Gemmatimonas sp.]
MNAQNVAHCEISPRFKGRMLAALFLVTIVAGIIAQMFIGDRLIDLNDAARTAANIAANRTLYRFAFTLYMIEMVSQIVWTLMMYDLLKPVSRSVARTAAVVGLIGCGIKMVARLFFYAPLLVTSSPAFSGIGEGELQALSLVLLRLNDHGAAIAVVFFGCESILEGWLIVKSRFLPRFLGVFSIAGGVGWATFMWPPLGYSLFTAIALVALVGSLLMIGWLFVKGVDERRWLEQVQESAASIWR